MINIDFDNINDGLVYKAFGVEGNEADALTIVIWNCLSLSVKMQYSNCSSTFGGDKIDCTIRLYSGRNLLPTLQRPWQIDVSVLKLQELGDQSCLWAN